MSSIQGHYIEHPAAYCRLHKCHLSTKTIKKRRCIEKKCWHLKKLKHGYWTTCEMLAQKRAERKARRKEILHGEKKGTADAVLP